MKNLITILTISILTISTAFATITPDAEGKIFSIDNLELFASADYNVENETLDFTTKSDMSMIQIFDLDGNMIFQLPVMSDSVQINKNLFERGSHKLGFIMQGTNQIHFTHVTVK